MAQNDLVVNISGNADKLKEALNATKKAIADTASKASSIDIIGDKFERIQSSTAGAGKKFSEIKKLMNELQRIGGADTPMFEQLAQGAADAQKKIDEVKNAINAAKEAGNQMTVDEKFQQITSSSDDAGTKLKNLRQMMIDLATAGQQDTPLFQQIQEEAGKCQAEIQRLNDITKQIDDSLKNVNAESQNLTLDEKFQQITSSSDNSAKKLSELKNMMTELLTTGQQDTPLFQKIQEEAVKCQKDVNKLNDAQKKVNETIRELTTETQKLSISDKFEQITSSTDNAGKKLTEIKELMTEFILAGQEDTPLFEQMQEEAKNCQAEIQKVKEATEKVNKALAETEQTAEKLTVDEEFRKIKESSDAANVKLDKTKALMLQVLQENGGKPNQKFKELAAQCREYQRELQRTELMTQRVEAATKKVNFGSIVTGFAGAATTVTGIMGMFGDAGDQATQSILQVQSALATLEGAKSLFSGGGAAALANPYVLAGAAIAGAGVALFQYNKNLAETLDKTSQFTGLTGNELMSVRNGIKSVADTWGKDYNDVLSAVDGITSQFGLDSESALQIVKDGFVAGCDENEHFLDLMSQYSGAFDDIGISASELAALIANTRSGIFSEQGLKVIEVAGKNIRSMSDTAKKSLEAIGISADDMQKKVNAGTLSTGDAIQMISNKLKEVPEYSAAAGDVMKNVFGKVGVEAGYELVTALADVNMNLEEMKEQTGDDGKALEALQEASRNLEDAMSSLFGISESGFDTMATQLKADVLQGLADVINYVIDLYNECAVLRGIVQTVGFAFKAVWEVCKMLIKNITAAFKGVAKVIEGVLTLDWEKIKSGITEATSSIAKSYMDAGKAIGNAFMDGVDNTVNHRIDKVMRVDDAGNGQKKTPGSSKKSPDVESNSRSKSSTKKTEVKVDEKSLKYAQDKLAEFEKKKIEIPIDDKAALDECKRNIEYWKNEIRNREAEIGISVSENSLKYISDRISELTRQKQEIDFEANPEKIQEINNEISELTEKQKRIELELGLRLPENCLKTIQDKISELNNKKLEIDPELNPEKIKEIDDVIKELTEKEHKIQVALKLVDSEATIKALEQAKQFEKGSIDDKRVSLQNFSSQLQQIKDDYANKLIDSSTAEQMISTLNEKLQEIGLQPITLTVNDDGTITTALEDLQKYQEQCNNTASEIGSLGSSFGSLGNAIGGAGGQMLKFTGQMLQSTAQIIPQIVKLIASKQAEATASGVASASAMPFPANLAAIASIVATVVSTFASIPKNFAEGGIVSGNMPFGDRIHCALNSGEMVLNPMQQSKLWRQINSNRPNNAIGGNVKFEISGTALKGVLTNVNNKFDNMG